MVAMETAANDMPNANMDAPIANGCAAAGYCIKNRTAAIVAMTDPAITSPRMGVNCGLMSFQLSVDPKKLDIWTTAAMYRPHVTINRPIARYVGQLDCTLLPTTLNVEGAVPDIESLYC